MADRPTTLRPSPHTTAWLLVVTVAVATLLPMVVVRGMALDGVIYATVARNLAMGIGDLWHPAYTDTLRPYHEAPPLGYLLGSIPFRVLGDHWWIERFYSVSTALPTGVLLVLIWRHFTRREPRMRSFDWLPISLWVLLPAWPWIYRHNYLENTLTVFTTLAVYASLARWRRSGFGLPGRWFRRSRSSPAC